MHEYAAKLLSAVNDARKDMALQSLGAGVPLLTEGLSSGSVKINMALSGNPLVGYAFGRIIEIFGQEQSGKTTLALHAIREAQKREAPCVFIDAEHALDPVYAGQLGVNLDDLLINQPDCGEDAISIAEDSLLNGARLIVIDSVAALTPRAELEGEVGDANIGKLGKLMSQAMRKLTGRCQKTGCNIIFINQVRHKIGVVFGNPEYTVGGDALKYFASYRLDVRSPRGGATKEKNLEGEEQETGIDTKVKVVKNKLYPPFRTATVHIDYGYGINKYLDLADYLASLNDGRKAIIDGKYYPVKKLADLLENDKRIRKLALAEMKKTREE